MTPGTLTVPPEGRTLGTAGTRKRVNCSLVRSVEGESSESLNSTVTSSPQSIGTPLRFRPTRTLPRGPRPQSTRLPVPRRHKSSTLDTDNVW